ncbi:5-methylthioadenosine/S-adenosylhomocysteine deaminase [Nocardia tenerifensis]|uniref:5-methylthioadenosine/S-adenosylhomocysteine deaminase n=1 Tax=Nocardia tenerifensis TaxID=228006 RepID=A0A318KBA4_9NOCA|nr:amidohydrolase [Nocardia tenerifensis]PXX71608.1 5-methylthioadenosine/S-adenosylhomocysteine deaminase [Nocardia tenerifensis]
MAPPSPKRCDLLLTGGTVITVDDARNVHLPGAVAVSGSRIVAVGTAAELADWRADTVLDCGGRAVLPGLVDGHNHLYQALARGLGEGMSIVPWLCEFMWPYSIAMTREDAVAAARLGAVEALRAGTTTVIDNHYAPSDLATTLAVADVIEDAGLRGVVARGVLGDRTAIAARRSQPPGLFRYRSADDLAITREALQHRPRGSKVEIWPAPLNLTYVDQDVVRGCAELAAEFDTKWHTHCCESRSDPRSYLEEYGLRPVQWLAEAGLLDERATLAHAIWLDDQEIEQVGAAGAGVAHNPASNAYLASGTMRLRELRSHGAPVSLGSDGSSCGHRQDLFEAMKLSIFAQRLSTLDPTAAHAEDALVLATREGAEYAGIDAGVLEPGRLADIIVVDLDRPHLRPLHRAVSSLVYSARGSDVETTIVGGQIVYDKGRCLLVDEEAAMAQAQFRAERLVARADMTALRMPWSS